MTAGPRRGPRTARPGRDRLLDRYAREFPGRGPAPEPPVERLEELLLTRIANENPALGPLRELVDDRVLAEGTRYADAIARPRTAPSPTATS